MLRHSFSHSWMGQLNAYDEVSAREMAARGAAENEGETEAREAAENEGETEAREAAEIEGKTDEPALAEHQRQQGQGKYSV